MPLQLYKKPGFFVGGFVGPFGVGKTLALIENALFLADKFRLDIAANFLIDQRALLRYAELKKYNNIRNSRILYVSDFKDFLKREYTVYLLDEAAKDFFSRGFAGRGAEDFADLWQIRHRFCYLLYTCQSYKQIDLQLKEVTDTFVECRGFQYTSSKLRRSVLVSRFQRAFSREAFDLYISDSAMRLKWFQPYFLAEWRFANSNLYAGRFIAFVKLFFTALSHFPHFLKEALKKGYLPLAFVYLEKFIKDKMSIGLIDEDYLFQVYNSFELVHIKKNKERMSAAVKKQKTADIQSFRKDFALNESYFACLAIPKKGKAKKSSKVVELGGSNTVRKDIDKGDS